MIFLLLFYLPDDFDVALRNNEEFRELRPGMWNQFWEIHGNFQKFEGSF